ncbi:MAG: FAD-binding oxidoreductase [Flavobacteriales bacterium]|nr:FAD-binding oxidoreductase [Flavobacteriales bacterium]
MEFSYWEKEFLLPHSDIIIVGAGIVGLTTAIYTSQKFPNKNVRILEKGAFNNGASTRNAGFACFGSPTELLSDLKNMGESQTKELLAKRYYGLKRLQYLVSPSFMEYQACGGVEVFCYRDGFQTSIPKKSDIEILNNLIEEAIGEKQAMVESTTLLA